MADDGLEMLGHQMRALSQSPKSDPVLKALTHLVWQLIDEHSKNTGDSAVHDMLMRMLREVHNVIAQRRRDGQFAWNSGGPDDRAGEARIVPSAASNLQTEKRPSV